MSYLLSCMQNGKLYHAHDKDLTVLVEGQLIIMY